MYFEDLTNYCYLDDVPRDDVLNVGWLDCSHPFEIGSVPMSIVKKLQRLLLAPHVHQTRGYHACSFCPTYGSFVTPQNGNAVFVPGAQVAEFDEFKISLGSAEIWVPSPNGLYVYAAPTLVYHYIVDHGYLPPKDFLDAVDASVVL